MPAELAKSGALRLYLYYFHFGLFFSMRSIFHCRFHSFNLFSLEAAKVISLKIYAYMRGDVIFLSESRNIGGNMKSTSLLFCIGFLLFFVSALSYACIKSGGECTAIPDEKTHCCEGLTCTPTPFAFGVGVCIKI